MSWRIDKAHGIDCFELDASKNLGKSMFRPCRKWSADMVVGLPGFFDVDDRLAELSAKGDGLERVKALVDFEMFRPALEAAVPRADRLRGGRPPFDHVLMFKVLILQAMHSLSDERCEYLIKDRLSLCSFSG
jgi:transposase, IS5 family